MQDPFSYATEYLCCPVEKRNFLTNSWSINIPNKAWSTVRKTVLVSPVYINFILNHILKSKCSLHHIIPLCLVTGVGLHIVDHIAMKFHQRFLRWSVNTFVVVLIVHISTHTVSQCLWTLKINYIKGLWKFKSWLLHAQWSSHSLVGTKFTPSTI